VILDSSALLAIVLDEPEREAFVTKITATTTCATPPPPGLRLRCS